MSDDHNTKKALAALGIIALVTVLTAVALFFLLMQIPFPSPDDFRNLSVDEILDLVMNKQNENIIVGRQSDVLEPGSTVRFGRYEQDNDLENGPEPIEWIILEQDNEVCLLISKYVLDAVPFHSSARTDVTWETCSLRTWLNSYFIKEAFSLDEQSGILTTHLENAHGNDVWRTDGGNDTEDTVFVLSYPEAIYYFETDEARRAKPTAYSKSRTLSHNGYSPWWLRSPGYSLQDTECVYNTGYIMSLKAYSFMNGIRPSIWVDIKILRH